MIVISLNVITLHIKVLAHFNGCESDISSQWRCAPTLFSNKSIMSLFTVVGRLIYMYTSRTNLSKSIQFFFNLI